MKENETKSIVPAPCGEVANTADVSGKILARYSHNSILFHDFSSHNYGKFIQTALSQDHTWLAVSHSLGVDIYDARRKHFVRHIAVGKDHELLSPVFLQPVFVQSGTHLLVIVNGSVLQLYEIRSGKTRAKAHKITEGIVRYSVISIASDRITLLTHHNQILCLEIPSFKQIWLTDLPFKSGDTRLKYPIDERSNKILASIAGAGFAIVDKSDGTLLHARETVGLNYCGWLSDDEILFQTRDDTEPNSSVNYNHWKQRVFHDAEPARLVAAAVENRIWTHFPSHGTYLSLAPSDNPNDARNIDVRSLENGQALMAISRFNSDLHKAFLNCSSIQKALETNDAELFDRELKICEATYFQLNFLGAQLTNTFRHSGACSSEKLVTLTSWLPYSGEGGVFLSCYDLITGKCSWQKKLYMGYPSSSFDMKLSPNGRYLAVKWNDLELFDISTGETLGKGIADFDLSLSNWHGICFAFDAASSHFICSDGETTNVFGLDPFEKASTLPYQQSTQNHGSQLSANEKYLLSMDDGSLAIFDRTYNSLSVLSSPGSEASHYGFCNDGQWVFHIKESNTLVIHDAKSMELMNETPLPLSNMGSFHAHPTKREIWITGIVAGSEARRYATIAITLPDMKIQTKCEFHEGIFVHGLGFVGQGKRFVTRSDHREITFWNVETGMQCASLQHFNSNPVWFLDDGSRHFWTDDTSRLAVLRRDASNPDDPGEIVTGEEREAFLKQHNKRELVMAAINGSPAYDKYLAVKDQLKQDQALEDLTLPPKLLK